MSADQRLQDYTKTLRMVAFCNIVVGLASTTALFLKRVEKVHDRFLYNLAGQGLIDDEINDYLCADEAAELIRNFMVDGLLPVNRVPQVVNLLGEMMKDPLIARWAAEDIIKVTVNYIHPIKGEAITFETIDSSKVVIDYHLNPDHKRGRALTKAIIDTLTKMGG